MKDRRGAPRTALVDGYLPPPGAAWAVHRAAIDVALTFERSIASSAKAKDRQAHLRAMRAPQEEPATFSGT